VKVAVVSSSAIPSDRANSIQVMKVCQALVQLGHAVTLLAPDTGQQAADPQQLALHYGLLETIPLAPVAAPSRRSFAWLAARRARRLGADLLYTRLLPVAVLGLLLRLPVVLEVHEMPAGNFGPSWFRLFLCIGGCKRLLLLTEALRAALRQVYRHPLPDGMVQIAPSGVDLERFKGLPDPETARRTLGLPPRPTVVCTGHLYAGRGAEIFLQLAPQMPSVHFLWVGGRTEDVHRWRERAGGISNLTFTGFIPNRELPLYQAAADILAMPYQAAVAGSSGGDIAGVFSPMKMFEYMACGRPILCSDLPALREVLDGGMAIFCPLDAGPVPGDRMLAAWQAAIETLLTDKVFATSLAHTARRAAAGYTWLERTRRALEGFGVCHG